MAALDSFYLFFSFFSFSKGRIGQEAQCGLY